MSGVLAITPIVLDDASRLEVLEARAFGATSWGAGGVSGTLVMHGVGGLKAVREDVLVGFCLWRVAAEEGDILTIAVDPACRRQGIGRALLQALADRAAAAPISTLFLEVAADNAAARRLYETNGFVAIGSREGYYRSGDSAILMKRIFNCSN
ncbi:MAG: ribosomal protein S18-alanine N-acetyltransferase [Pseudomonadota bacterium]